MSYMSDNASFVSASGVQTLTLDEIDGVSGGVPRWLAAAGGVAFGVGEGAEVAGLVRAGMLGAEIGGFAGPIGFAAGAVGGIGAYYLLRHVAN